MSRTLTYDAARRFYDAMGGRLDAHAVYEDRAIDAMVAHLDLANARRVFEFVSESRHQQDNEQWHLLILVEMTGRQGRKEGFLRFRLIPQLIAFFYYHVSWLLYVIRPGLSYELNAHFEDHAEHEYMEYVRENPQLETTPFKSDFEEDYGSFASQADLFRQIGLDERHHKLESLERLKRPRFS